MAKASSHGTAASKEAAGRTSSSAAPRPPPSTLVAVSDRRRWPRPGRLPAGRPRRRPRCRAAGRPWSRRSPSPAAARRRPVRAAPRTCHRRRRRSAPRRRDRPAAEPVSVIRSSITPGRAPGDNARSTHPASGSCLRLTRVRYDLTTCGCSCTSWRRARSRRGARRMHLSLPSASARVRALEHHAGVALLIRGRRGVGPPRRAPRWPGTRATSSTRPPASKAPSPATPGPRPRPLTLLAGSSALHRLVPRALISFLRAHPDPDVTVLREPHPADRADARRRARPTSGIVVDDEARDCGLDTEPLGDDSLVVIGQAGRRSCAGRTALTLPRGRRAPAGRARRRLLAAPLDRQHLGPHAPVARHRTTVADLGTLVALAAAGVGLAVVPRRALDPPASRWTCANCRSPGPAATTCWPGAPRPAPTRVDGDRGTGRTPAPGGPLLPARGIAETGPEGATG